MQIQAADSVRIHFIDFTNLGDIKTNLIFRPLEMPPKVTVELATTIKGDRCSWQEVAATEWEEADFLRAIKDSVITSEVPAAIE